MADKGKLTRPSRLIAAAKAGEDNLIEEYMTDPTKNIDINKADSLGQTSVHWACASGYPTTVETLVRFGAQIDLPDKAGETPLHKAAWRGSAECVELLLKLGADRNARNEKGQTPLDLARVREVRRLLLTQIPDPNAVDDDDDEDDDEEVDD